MVALNVKMSEVIGAFCGSLLVNTLFFFILYYTPSNGMLIIAILYNILLFAYAFKKLLVVIRDEKTQAVFIEDVRKKRQRKNHELP